MPYDNIKGLFLYPVENLLRPVPSLTLVLGFFYGACLIVRHIPQIGLSVRSFNEGGFSGFLFDKTIKRSILKLKCRTVIIGSLKTRLQKGPTMTTEQIKLLLPMSLRGDWVFYPLGFVLIISTFFLIAGLVCGFIPKFYLKKTKLADDDDTTFSIILLQGMVAMVGFVGYYYYKNATPHMRLSEHIIGMSLFLFMIVLPIIFCSFLCAVLDVFSLGVGFFPGCLIKMILWLIKKILRIVSKKEIIKPI